MVITYNEQLFLTQSQMLVSLLQRELHHAGIDMSIPAMIDALSGIREVAITYPPVGRHHREPQIVVSKSTAIQRRLFDVLNRCREPGISETRAPSDLGPAASSLTAPAAPVQPLGSSTQHGSSSGMSTTLLICIAPGGPSGCSR